MPRPLKQEERSEAIMQAFELCVARSGIAATTLSDIAAEAGLARSLVRYFVGNRDEMVDRLIERVVSRGQASLSRIRGADGAMDIEALLDLFFFEILADELSNSVIGELWSLAKTDEHVRGRLRDTYRYAIDLLDAALSGHAPAASPAAREGAAHAILALALGASTLDDFGVLPPRPDGPRRAAGRIADSLVGKPVEAA